MSVADDALKREITIQALERLSNGGQWSRKQLFADPRMGGGKARDWHYRVLHFLREHGIVEQTGDAKHVVYELVDKVHGPVELGAFVLDDRALTKMIWPNQLPEEPDAPEEDEVAEQPEPTEDEPSLEQVLAAVLRGTMTACEMLAQLQSDVTEMKQRLTVLEENSEVLKELR